ncbi:hypothetical protein [Shewanella cyperi]|uniref:hypothetical protein n=1 Tax=Shewanella cyperi TaxID=2814292 RepID=UPI001A940002|nr:hypothetical protein [Shewanella cyperi]QSX39343.1 hypothetical protein JYB84_09770 [Shewanella cyperi]
MKPSLPSALIPSALILALLGSAQAYAHDHSGGITATAQPKPTPFDIVHAKVSVENNVATFHMAVSGAIGTQQPRAGGKLAGADAFAYVWPTSINSYELGFDKDAGILALAVASHPDFDDTPLFDENRDANTGNDGASWHSHWVVLVPDEKCGPGALTVKDIPEGGKPRLPATWPGLPLLIDSPGWDPVLNGDTVEIKVPFANADIIKNASYDGVTAGLRVNANIHAPLFCVVNVMDVASGDLSLPGKVLTTDTASVKAAKTKAAK